MPKANIFPMFLDNAAIVVSTAGALPVTTSFIILDSGSSLAVTLPDGVETGQLMTLFSKNGGAKVITVTNDITADADVITLGSAGQSVLLMWNGSAWATLTASGTPA
jgi:hypothetical protein